MSGIKDVKITRSNNDLYFVVDGEVDKKTAETIQKEAGYHPAGYGFYAYRIDNGKTYWHCSNSCD